MRLLKRNCTTATYYPYSGFITGTNAYGQHTGENKVVYGDAVKLRRVNLSTASGYASQNLFGKDTPYTYVLLVDDLDAGIEEHGLIVCEEQVFEITAVRKSLNVVSVALKKSKLSVPLPSSGGVNA